MLVIDVAGCRTNSDGFHTALGQMSWYYIWRLKEHGKWNSSFMCILKVSRLIFKKTVPIVVSTETQGTLLCSSFIGAKLEVNGTQQTTGMYLLHQVVMCTGCPSLITIFEYHSSQRIKHYQTAIRLFWQLWRLRFMEFAKILRMSSWWRMLTRWSHLPWPTHALDTCHSLIWVDVFCMLSIKWLNHSTNGREAWRTADRKPRFSALSTEKMNATHLAVHTAMLNRFMRLKECCN